MELLRCHLCDHPVNGSGAAPDCRSCAEQLRWQPGPAPAARSQSPGRSRSDGLAAVTELYQSGGSTALDAVGRARRLLDGLTVADLREVALSAAVIASGALRVLDAGRPGLGQHMLQSYGVTLAQADA